MLVSRGRTNLTQPQVAARPARGGPLAVTSRRRPGRTARTRPVGSPMVTAWSIHVFYPRNVLVHGRMYISMQEMVTNDR